MYYKFLFILLLQFSSLAHSSTQSIKCRKILLSQKSNIQISFDKIRAAELNLSLEQFLDLKFLVSKAATAHEKLGLGLRPREIEAISLSPGEEILIDGETYQIKAILGNGGTGFVYRATNVSSDQMVAVKKYVKEANRIIDTRDFERRKKQYPGQNLPEVLVSLGRFMVLEYIRGVPLDVVKNKYELLGLTKQESDLILAISGEKGTGANKLISSEDLQVYLYDPI